MAGLALCTETQRRRYFPHALDDLSFAELSKFKGCRKYSVRDSIEAMRKKYREIYNIGPRERLISG